MKKKERQVKFKEIFGILESRLLLAVANTEEHSFSVSRNFGMNIATFK
jgi:hypothetical protein